MRQAHPWRGEREQCAHELPAPLMRARARGDCRAREPEQAQAMPAEVHIAGTCSRAALLLTAWVLAEERRCRSCTPHHGSRDAAAGSQCGAEQRAQSASQLECWPWWLHPRWCRCQQRPHPSARTQSFADVLKMYEKLKQREEAELRATAAGKTVPDRKRRREGGDKADGSQRRHSRAAACGPPSPLCRRQARARGSTSASVGDRRSGRRGSKCSSRTQGCCCFCFCCSSIQPARTLRLAAARHAFHHCASGTVFPDHAVQREGVPACRSLHYHRAGSRARRGEEAV